MGRARKGAPRCPAGLTAVSALGALLVGCASLPGSTPRERQIDAEPPRARPDREQEPEVRAARAVVEAALATEDAPVVLDGFEVRASGVHERDEKMSGLLRLPIRNPLEVAAQRDARRAETEVAVARLQEVELARYVAVCVPSVRHLALEERKRIYGDYADRYSALLAWNEELRRAGMLDEVRLSRFELESRVALTTRDPSGIPSPLAPFGLDRLLDALPEPAGATDLLRDELVVVRERVVSHQPAVAAHRASRRQLEALARSERVKRLPMLKFVDFGFEPVPFPRAKRQWEGRISVDLPFGREASANTRRYQALASAERSGERAVVEERLRQARLALEEINAFRLRGGDWLGLASLADRAEEVADRWWRNRLADPGQIAGLLDSVHAARLAVVEARERAGLAGCAVTAATGISIADWR